MVLGTLSQHGPRHGHEIRRIAEVTNVGEWGGVSVGALYRELRGMEAEGLVEAVRTEQVGRRPARTVYAITSEGTVELRLLAEQAIRSTQPPADPLGVALSFAATGTDLEELTSWLRSRREIFALHVMELEAERQRLVSRGHLGPLQAAVMYRGQLHAETEVRWHDEFAKVLAELPASALPTGEPPASELPGGSPASEPPGGSPASEPPGGPATPAGAATRDST
jgi:DNA-binding PadR family transcriptional regulator